MNLYLVQFATGEYEDYHIINLALFATPEEAQAHVTELKEAYSNWDCLDFDYEEKPYQLGVDYNGPSFFFSEIPFKSPDIVSTITNHHPELFI